MGEPLIHHEDKASRERRGSPSKTIDAANGCKRIKPRITRTQSNFYLTRRENYIMKIGIDVSKKELAIYANEKYSVIVNTEEGLNLFLKNHAEYTQGLWVFESTGGYERILKAFLLKANIGYRQVHANRIRDYAKSTGIFAKTDKIDARVIAAYAQERNLTAQNEEVKRDEKLTELSTRCEQLKSNLTQEKNRLETCGKIMGASVKKHIKWIEKEIKSLDKFISEYFKTNETLKKQEALISSVPGIGRVTTTQLIANLPEIHTHDINVLRRLVGIAPINKDSGSVTKKRCIGGGRKSVRNALYMAAISAIRCELSLKIYYQKMINKGKPVKVAIVAVMGKLLAIVKSVVLRGTPYVENFAR